MRTTDSVPALFAIVCVGAIPAVLAYPNPRLHPDSSGKVSTVCLYARVSICVFTERDLEETVRPSLEKQTARLKAYISPWIWKPGHALTKEQLERVITGHNMVNRVDPCCYQHSSGTTGLQKTRVLSHCAVLEHVNILRRELDE